MRQFALLGLAVLVPVSLRAQGPELSRLTRSFVSVDAPVVALTHVRVIDGTGAPPRPDRTLILADGVIRELGHADSVEVPGDAEVLDLTDHTVLPGLVMVHEHLFYPTGDRQYAEQAFSFPRLYLAGGATTIRTGGSMEPYTDLNLRRAIEAGEGPGPTIDVTGPYLNGPGLPILFVKALRGPEDARRMVEYWADEGVTSFKAYMQVSRAELGAAIEAAHLRDLKVTGHLCSVTYAEAAELGIDNLEHGFLAATDFVADKAPDECPPNRVVTRSLLEVDPAGREMRGLMRTLIEADVALTSTLPVFETFTPHRPALPERVLDLMLPRARELYLGQRARIAGDTISAWIEMFPKELELERRFVEMGGTLLAGTDPTGYGGVIAGFANHRQLELLVEAGLSPVEAIRIGTLNGARYLGRDARIGSIARGKAADLLIVRGDPSRRIADIENVEVVFKDGIGYDPELLIESVRGRVGLH